MTNTGKIAVALTIAGSDPSGGAGIQADLKTFHQFGVYGMSVPTLLTVQNTFRSGPVEYLSPEFVLLQLEAVLEDIPPQAAKTGALGSARVIEAIAERAARFHFPLVIDPVMIGKHGTPLMAPDAQQVFIEKLLPLAYLVTPNIEEAFALAGLKFNGTENLETVARGIAGKGAKNVLITGGHGKTDATDLLLTNDGFERFPSKRIETPHTHGTGCTFSAAITAELALGKNLLDAIASAKRYITCAIETNPGLGHGNGPVNHWATTEVK